MRLALQAVLFAVADAFVIAYAVAYPSSTTILTACACAGSSVYLLTREVRGAEEVP